ncbi:helix-turn-helix transcriptional regulator [Halomonas binhaiensis]|uniref:Helix-turn-helix transcriptional regulator n=1 Tax=Halomonas binhaiensis TaxID=2562282 RepID=A0A5C1NHV9_9GAMM|nr:helix-turn-helix transcriptional regulator [Halomonas binhaiensis]QEM83282.1 helix-turn-helix transcriptional regulator [Halomonas binhaiensis]
MNPSDLLATSTSQEWHQSLATLIRSAADADLPRRLEQALQRLINFDTVVLHAYRNRSRPMVIHDNYPPHRREAGVDKYLSRIYLLDPIFLATESGIDSGAHRLKELAPDRFESSEYYDHYYRSLGLKDEVGLFARVSDDTVMVVSLGFSAESPPLTRRSMQTLRNLTPVVAALLSQFWTWQSTRFDDAMTTAEPVDLAFSSFGQGQLTRREQEIVQLLLAGHSAKSAARELGISDGTVKVHRKHLYQRLGVSSQAQLFRTFLDHVALISRQHRQ